MTLSACADDADGGSDVGAIEAERARSNEALERHDVDGVVAFLEEDARLTTSDGRFFAGREQQRAAYAEQMQMFPDTIYVRSPTLIEISRPAPLAAEHGDWVGHWTAQEGAVRIRGSYLAMWRKVAGRWRIRSELYVLLDCQGSGCPGSERSIARSGPAAPEGGANAPNGEWR